MSEADERVRQDRAETALAMADDLEFIAIAKASPGAIADPSERFRLHLLGGVTGDTDEAKLDDARKQAELKMKPWESIHVLYRLVPAKTS